MHEAYTFVLIHGAWHEGTLWASVAEHLRRAGHTVHTPTVAGHGKGVRKDVNFAEGVISILDYILTHDVSSFVLVGHSSGGPFISRVAEEMPVRIRRLVYLNAFVLRDGESINDVSPPPYEGMLASIVAQRIDGCTELPFEVFRDAFVADADVATAREIHERLSPTPYRMHTDKVSLRSFYELKLPRTYLNAQDDVAMPPGAFAWYPRFAERLFPCRVVQMAGSHEVMFTNPGLLATKLWEASRD